MGPSRTDNPVAWSPQILEEYGECDHCRQEGWLAVVESGRYCSRHLPPDDLARLVDDLT